MAPRQLHRSHPDQRLIWVQSGKMLTLQNITLLGGNTLDSNGGGLANQGDVVVLDAS
jgi:hypothetical protein